MDSSFSNGFYWPSLSRLYSRWFLSVQIWQHLNWIMSCRHPFTSACYCNHWGNGIWSAYPGNSCWSKLDFKKNFKKKAKCVQNCATCLQFLECKYVCYKKTQKECIMILLCIYFLPPTLAEGVIFLSTAKLGDNVLDRVRPSVNTLFDLRCVCVSVIRGYVLMIARMRSIGF